MNENGFVDDSSSSQERRGCHNWRERETRPRLAGRTKERKKAVIKRRDFYAQTKTRRTTHSAQGEEEEEDAHAHKGRNAYNTTRAISHSFTREMRAAIWVHK